MSSTNGSSQFIRLSDGTRALYDAYDYSLHRPKTDQMTSGVFYHNLGKWFSSAFTYNMYLYVNSMAPYDNPTFRASTRANMETTGERYCPMDLIRERKMKYKIYD